MTVTLHPNRINRIFIALGLRRFKDAYVYSPLNRDIVTSAFDKTLSIKHLYGIGAAEVLHLRAFARKAIT
jgi:hypothetical protein